MKLCVLWVFYYLEMVLIWGQYTPFNMCRQNKTCISARSWGAGVSFTPSFTPMGHLAFPVPLTCMSFGLFEQSGNLCRHTENLQVTVQSLHPPHVTSCCVIATFTPTPTHPSTLCLFKDAGREMSRAEIHPALIFLMAWIKWLLCLTWLLIATNALQNDWPKSHGANMSPTLQVSGWQYKGFVTISDKWWTIWL